MSSSAKRAGARREIRRAPAVLLAMLMAGAVAVAGAWAIGELSTPVEVEPEREPTYVQVTSGEVGSTLTLGATVEWTREPMTPNRAVGVVTSLPADGIRVAEGDSLYSVDLRPVVLGIGDIPMFRDIDESVRGEDVAQLQAMLGRLNFYRGAVDGISGPATKTAIREWQQKIGLPQDGIVRERDIVFTSKSPVTVSVAPDRQVGDEVAGGETVLEQVADTPRVFLGLSDSQRALVAEGMRVTSSLPDGTFLEGVLGPVSTNDETARAEMLVLNQEGGPFCDEACGSTSAADSLLMEIEQTEKVSGLSIPITAIRTNGAGEAFVVSEGGNVINVEVVASANGVAIVSSPDLADGQRVVINE